MPTPNSIALANTDRAVTRTAQNPERIMVQQQSRPIGLTITGDMSSIGIMKTTLDIQDELLVRAKRHARNTGRPLRAVVEEGLCHVLSAAPKRCSPETATSLYFRNSEFVTR